MEDAQLDFLLNVQCFVLLLQIIMLKLHFVQDSNIILNLSYTHGKKLRKLYGS